MSTHHQAPQASASVPRYFLGVASPFLGRLVPVHPPPPSLHSLASARAHLPLCLTSQCDTLSQGQSTGAPQPHEPALASTSGASGSTEDSQGPSRSQLSLPPR